MSENKPSFRYRSLQTGRSEWTVFVIDEREPDWWRIVARFSNKDRADSYADIENMTADDGIENSFQDLVCGNIPPLSIPRSNITSAAIMRRESISNTTIEREETISLPASGGTVQKSDHLETETLVSCASLPPLTPQQGKVFHGLVAAIEEEGGRPPYSSISRHSGVKGVAAHLPNLETKGYIKNYGTFGAPDWRPLAIGEPQIEEPTDSRGRIVRQWTDEEIDGLSELAPALDDDYAKYAEKIDRTVDAVIQKARTLRCFKPSLVPGYTKPQQTAAPAPVNKIGKSVTRVVRRIDNSANEHTCTAELMGDPAPGRSAAEKSDFDVRAYLVKKGHTAFMAGLTWVVDGRTRTPREVLEIVNGHRTKADLPPLDMDAIP